MAQNLRSVLHSAFAYVRSGEVNKASSSLTLDHLLLEQISFLKKGEKRSIVDGKGESVGSRPSRYDQLDAMLTSVKSAVRAVRDAGSDEQKLSELGVASASSVEVAV